MTDYYKLLGIQPDASIDEIKRAYRQLALRYHPDQNPGDQNAETHFKRITEAYTILSDSEERESYDYELKRNQQTRTNKEQQAKADEPKQTKQITPQYILEIFQDITSKINRIEKNRINQSTLYKSLNDLLTIHNINFLIAYGDIKTNELIIKEAIICCKYLAYPYLENIIPKLIKLANSNNEIVQKILLFSKKQKYYSYWKRYKAFTLMGAIIIFIVYASNSNNHTTSFNSSNSDNRPLNGDLNNTFVEGQQSNTSQKKSSSKSTYPAEITPEQLLQKEKDKLIADGWEETVINNGQLPLCYNFVPKKSKIDNYLEVQVGGGTDVAIKLMNFKTDKCIRYVYINRNSTFRIKNIPEGKYYLKIAYGKDWFSKVEDGQCVGKFIRNPMYEKGDNIMDFNLQHTDDGYSIPSFQLKLDIISTNKMNTFDSQNISENEFNQ
jgi:curved DNA-binding protein CbpA